MKRYISYVVLFFAAAVSVHAQAAPDAAELTRLLNEFLGGVSSAAVHDRFWADDLIYTRSAGVRTNKEEIMKGLRSAPAAKPGDPVTVYTAEDIVIHQYGDAAVVAFKLVGNTTKADGTKTATNNLNTGTFIKRKGNWQVVAWQSTVIPEPKPAAQTYPTETKATPLVATPSTSSAAETRVYLKGSRGGCYYLNASGNKTYVSHDLCK
ncbi:MAG: nuclear transport factor 2 family protein [Pyrinomonadaceae bacterium]